MPISKEKLCIRFWGKVKKGKTCWEWSGAKIPKGYGQLGFLGKHTYAHRVSWELCFGKIPQGLCVLHKCDNPPCVNPKHLFLGTIADNNRDMFRKNRGFHWPKGITTLSALKFHRIQRLLRAGKNPKQIRRITGVSWNTAQRIRDGVVRLGA